ncbi:hypothetical protein HU200_042567 [Digitaria exilis]|uniref:Uncharacterized protein n=1 Tax=Digitaria exilis TaxID=1010633 RepID=A0A835BFM8_9POAL|nr:hypothetical protein HU200_042567 [Digitaria exilis]
MRRLARDDEHDTGAFVRLVPELEATRLPAPVLPVQVTRPADGDGAVAVGVSIRHAVADGHAVWQFLKAWSTASREGPGSLAAPGFVQPTFDRTGIILRSTSSEPEIMQQISTRTFLLRADGIRSLKQQILRQSSALNSGAAPSKPPSTYVAIVSLVWASIARAKLTTMLDADDGYIMVTADCHSRLRTPLDDGFFGNCVKPCVARVRAGDLRGEATGVARAAAAIQHAIHVHLEGDPLSDAERWVAAYGAIPKERLVAVGSSNRFMAYETDFGWGGPSRVELVSVFAAQLVTLLGARDGGVQVSVALDRGTMVGFAPNLVVSAPILAVGVAAASDAASIA